MKNIEKLIRELARHPKYQTIYSQEKNLGLKLFYNDIDFTFPQIRLLNRLGFYSVLYLDVNLGEVGEIVLDNDIYEDAYMYWRSQQSKKRGEQQTNLDNKPRPGNNQIGRTSQWIFKKPKKGE